MFQIIWHHKILKHILYEVLLLKTNFKNKINLAENYRIQNFPEISVKNTLAELFPHYILFNKNSTFISVSYNRSYFILIYFLF